MKQTTAALFLLALMALAFAQHEAQQQCQQQEEEQKQMQSCRDYLEHKCTASAMPITWPWRRRMSSCQALRRRCCQQLGQMAPPCRCKAICRAFQQIQQGQGHQIAKAREMAMSLPSTCNMYPSYCNIPPTGACY